MKVIWTLSILLSYSLPLPSNGWLLQANQRVDSRRTTCLVLPKSGFRAFYPVTPSLALTFSISSLRYSETEFGLCSSRRLWLHSQISAAKTATALIMLFTVLLFPISEASASSYGSLSDEQKVVAEAWRLVDNSYLDRTFNGQDWFGIRQEYVHKRKYKNMEEARVAMDAMVSSLGDKYTRYLSPAKYQSIVDSATGTLAGVGVEISIDSSSGQLLVTDVEENSPAKTAEILPGDRFLAVDGVSFENTDRATPDDVALQLRGPEGTRVGVVMERNGQKMDYILTRKPITIASVKSYMTSTPEIEKVGVIRIKSFSGTTASTVSSKLADLRKKGAKSFVLDLRGNPGGLLNGGVETASIFLDANKPVTFVVNKNGLVDAQSTFTMGSELESPLVVLVDGNTASAAEVFTAALQENGRAIVAGQRTFGKGIIQTIRPLSDNNGGLAITVARYETPEHHDINKEGIPVDVPTSVECPKDDASLCLKSSIFKKPT